MHQRRPPRSGELRRRVGTRPRDGEERPPAPPSRSLPWPLVAGLLSGAVLVVGVALGLTFGDASAPGSRGQVAPARSVPGR